LSYRAITEFYDAEYADAELLRHDVPFFLEHLPSRCRRVLELCCGTGRAAIPIAQSGRRVVGVDYDADMVSIAKQKRDVSGLTDRQLKLLEQDALKLDVKADGPFDVATIFFNTFLNFTTLEQQDALLTRTREHLRPGGYLWLDVFNPDPARLASPQKGAEKHLFHVPGLDRTVLRETDLAPDPTAQITHVTFRYTWFDRAGRRRTATKKFDLTFLFPRELRLLLERNGFTVERQWGDYDGSPVGDDGPRLIVLARATPSPR
jgi:SAM-dependent methyltransferase